MASLPFSSVLKKQRKRASFILLGIALHLDKCNTAGRMHRWINFRRYNTARGQTPGEMKCRMGSFMRAIKKGCWRPSRKPRKLRKSKIHRWHSKVVAASARNINRHKYITRRRATFRGTPRRKLRDAVARSAPTR
ncbi:hypothetical protein PUN28_017327 [Cardiocondyla obscurior]|uniref:Uncharacterized protein n=1 Tax=Cardiocondyla obscurior TaxID=286306 RepID=A0AAW2ENG0_9HYME